jgi:ATP-dependent RNA helicase DDX49/DBP8
MPKNKPHHSENAKKRRKIEVTSDDDIGIDELMEKTMKRHAEPTIVEYSRSKFESDKESTGSNESSASTASSESEEEAERPIPILTKRNTPSLKQISKDSQAKLKPTKTETFIDLGLGKWLGKQLEEMSIAKPTEVQQACIPPTLAGRDVIASAKTGSGKTAAFALPILDILSKDPHGIFALVLTPTRELAFQIAEQFKALGTPINVRLSVITGGTDVIKQGLELEARPHVVVATPGRMVDHIKTHPERLQPLFKNLKFLVLDEADRMLEPGFAEEMSSVLDILPKANAGGKGKRQTLLYSATMTDMLKQMKFKHREPAFVWETTQRYDTVTQLKQSYLIVPSQVKEVYLVYLLLALFSVERDPTLNVTNAKKKQNLINLASVPTNAVGGPKSIIIFVNKALTAERIRIMLRALDMAAVAMHSTMSQRDRIASLSRFKSNQVQILIATDVGGRGLDIPEVGVVVNYDVPADATDYIHRVGRTARAGRGGIATTLVSEHDVALILNIEQKMEKKLDILQNVVENDVLKMLDGVSAAKRVASLDMSESGIIDKARRKKKTHGAKLEMDEGEEI